MDVVGILLMHFGVWPIFWCELLVSGRVGLHYWYGPVDSGLNMFLFDSAAI